MKNFTLIILLSVFSIFANAQNPEFNWEENELSPNNNLKSMAITDSIAFIVGHSSSFFKSDDNGASWEALNLFDPAHNLYDISIKGNVGYLVAQREKLYDASPDVYANGYILKTTDGGATWSAIDTAILGLVSDPALSPSDTLCHGLDFLTVETVNDTVAYCALRWFEYQKSGNDSHTGIFKTSDGGATWMNVSGDLGSNTTNAIVFDGDKGFLAGNKHLYMADATCDTLVDIFSSLPGDGSDYIWDVTIVDTSEILFSTTSDSIYFSNDGGITFEKFPGIEGGYDIIRVNDSTLVVGGKSNKSYASTDNGQTWSAMGISTSIWEIAGVINDTVFMMAKADIYKCAVTDLVAGNYNFTVQTVGTSNLQKAYVNNNELIIVGNDKNFYKSTDAGVTWTTMELPGNPNFDFFLEEIDFDVVSMNGAEGYACFNRFKFVDYAEKNDIYWSGGILYTDDNWATYDDLDIAKIGKENKDDTSINPNHVDCNGVNTSFIKYLGDDVLLLWARWYDYSSGDQEEHSRVFKTADGGKNWVAITEDLEKIFVQDIEVEGDTLYIVGKEMFMRSTSADLKSATTVLDFENLYPILDEGEDDDMFIKSIWSDGNELFLTTTSDSCFMSNDFGQSFTTMGGIKGSNDFYRFDSNSFIMLGGTGKSKFTNDATNWIDCHPGATCYSVGGVYNGKIYGLARGSIFTSSVEDLDLTTGIPMTLKNNKLDIRYTSTSVDLVSTGGEIERCALYTANGQLISVQAPNNNVCRFYNNKFHPGVYIVNSFVEGKRYTNKILFR